VIRLTWRQFRTQATVTLGALAVIGVILAVTGAGLVHLYDATVTPCAAVGDCEAAMSALAHRLFPLQSGLNALLLVAPALIGVFWGAPLVARELETGTFRLAWAQSVTRSHWLVVKLAILGMSSMVVAGLLSLMVTWWFSPIDTVNMNRFGAGIFGARGITPIGYAAFAFALGVTAGILIRRTLPAMATTLVAFTAARIAMTAWVRPHLIDPIHVTSAFKFTSGVEVGGAPGGSLVARMAVPNAWIYSSPITNAAGQAVRSDLFDRGVCLQSRAATDACAANLRQVLIYQPAGRYWAFQFWETTIFIGVALILAGFCVWWVRHRLG
jgi:hypothetical protein